MLAEAGANIESVDIISPDETLEKIGTDIGVKSSAARPMSETASKSTSLFARSRSNSVRSILSKSSSETRLSSCLTTRFLA